MKKILLFISVVFLIAASWILYSGIFKNNFNLLYKTGDPIDSLNGVVVYYNGNINNTHGRKLSPDGYNIGLKYQCVEFVKRYYYEYYGHKMPNSFGHAKDFFAVGIKDGELNKDRDLLQFTNPSVSKPAVNDLIVFRATAGNPYGHVAIISEVKEDEIQIIQQNGGPLASTRVYYDLSFSSNKWKIESTTCVGWLRKKKE